MGGRRTACTKLFEVLDPDERNVEFVRDNIEVLKQRFSNKNKDLSGATVEEYARRVLIVIDDYTQWSADRAAWERAQAGKQASRSEKKPRAEKPKLGDRVAAGISVNDQETVTATFPFPGGRKVTVILPSAGLSMLELKRLGYYLIPYANDWQPPETMPSDGGSQGQVEDFRERP